jgi:ATP-binding cassette subfamily B (MDR/TAP) protein 1
LPLTARRYGRCDFDAMLKSFFGVLFAAIGISQSALQFPEMGNAKSAVQRVFPLLDRV